MKIRFPHRMKLAAGIILSCFAPGSFSGIMAAEAVSSAPGKVEAGTGFGTGAEVESRAETGAEAGTEAGAESTEVKRAVTFNFGGYVKDMQGFYYLENPIPLSLTESFRSTTFNQIHNRLNLEMGIGENLRISAGMRNRLMMGPMVKDLAGYAGFYESDDGLVDLSFNLAEGGNWFLNTALDRLFIDYTLGNLQFRLGRQRINWGINLVWNPNDLFNAFSYIDFDYEERPGSDAALVTWYTSESSSLDVALKTGADRKTTLAARYLFNTGGADWQVIGGKNGDDWVVGGGFSGNLGPVSLRGEGSFFTPLPGKGTLSSPSVSATLGADYSITDDWFVQASFLFNSMGSDSVSISLLDPNYQLSAKQLSMGNFELFAQTSYAFSPILNGSVALMLNPRDGSCYLGPTLTLSLTDNLELMATGQLMLGEVGSEYGAMGNIFATFGRLRWSF